MTVPMAAAMLCKGDDGLEHAWTGDGTLCRLDGQTAEVVRHLFYRRGYRPPALPPCPPCVELLPPDYPDD